MQILGGSARGIWKSVRCEGREGEMEGAMEARIVGSRDQDTMEGLRGRCEGERGDMEDRVH
eukprot:6233411-Pyramimonas_sp.AAC.1